MSEQSVVVVANSTDGSDLKIVDLPPELLLRIFANLEIRTLFRNVILTCKAFHNVLGAEGVFKTLFPLKWGESIPIVDDLNYISDWAKLYGTFDDINLCWRSKSNKLMLRTLHGHYAPVDSIHLMSRGKICVTGARDRTAIVWDISAFQRCNNEEDLTTVECPKKDVLGQHSGWVWTIGSDEFYSNDVITGCWDAKLRIWDLQNGCTLKDTCCYHRAAILCLQARDGLIYTGCYDKHVRVYDRRSSSVVQDYSCHQRPVLSLEVMDDLILSGSEDKTIGIYDRRNCRVISNIRLDCTVMCLSLSHELGFSYLRAGGSGGSLYTYDTSGSRFTLLNSERLWNGHKVTQICNFHGSVLVCSGSGRIHPYTPGRSVRTLLKSQAHGFHNGVIADAHARFGVLATACSDDSAGIWKFEKTGY